MIQAYVTPIACAIAYRIRGGGVIHAHSGVLIRLIWTATFLASAIWTQPDLLDNPTLIAALTIFTYGASTIPHDFCYGDGRYWIGNQAENLQFHERWPGAWLKIIPAEDWKHLRQWQRSGYDALGMASVGLVRGIMVLPWLAFVGASWPHIAEGVGIITLGSPFAYWLSWNTPLRIPHVAEPRCTEWGELYVGAIWALSLMVVLR